MPVSVILILPFSVVLKSKPLFQLGIKLAEGSKQIRLNTKVAYFQQTFKVIQFQNI